MITRAISSMDRHFALTIFKRLMTCLLLSRYLDDMGFDSSRVNLVLPDTAPDSGIYCVDTVKLFSALEGEKQGKKLERIVRLLNIRDGERFHNAGNDAHVSQIN